jgi:aldehyde dehydrogenase (NAD+)
MPSHSCACPQCHNIFDAAAGFGGRKESGFGREGGKEGLYHYVKLAGQPRVRVQLTPQAVDAKWGEPISAIPGAGPLPSASSGAADLPAIDRSPKMYIGGAQKRPDGNYSYTIHGNAGEVLGQVGDGSRKDIRDAVEAAHAAAGGWGKRAAHNRAQILYYMAGQCAHSPPVRTRLPAQMTTLLPFVQKTCQKLRKRSQRR